ncbi:hypothetical protein HAX54_003275 [Datura stramonium]|uniref:Uncharacterized protein n=1 Tax=Datura stramonium TaxID=4076 RepID=A0ABS8RTF8_DATST|nr:hypothetical protein [Datura stramonium]
MFQVGLDFTDLDAWFPLLNISRSVLGNGVENQENDDVNTQDLMYSASKGGEDVDLGSSNNTGVDDDEDSE